MNTSSASILEQVLRKKSQLIFSVRCQAEWEVGSYYEKNKINCHTRRLKAKCDAFDWSTQLLYKAADCRSQTVDQLRFIFIFFSHFIESDCYCYSSLRFVPFVCKVSAGRKDRYNVRRVEPLEPTLTHIIESVSWWNVPSLVAQCVIDNCSTHVHMKCEASTQAVQRI